MRPVGANHFPVDRGAIQRLIGRPWHRIGESLRSCLARGFDRRQLTRVNREETPMEIIVIQPIVALIAGILILIVPRLLNYIVAIYLILVGITGLLGHV
jgi:hypothetical protein